MDVRERIAIVEQQKAAALAEQAAREREKTRPAEQAAAAERELEALRAQQREIDLKDAVARHQQLAAEHEAANRDLIAALQQVVGQVEGLLQEARAKDAQCLRAWNNEYMHRENTLYNWDASRPSDVSVAGGDFEALPVWQQQKLITAARNDQGRARGQLEPSTLTRYRLIGWIAEARNSSERHTRQAVVLLLTGEFFDPVPNYNAERASRIAFRG